MSRRHRQLRVRDPNVFLLLLATPLAHRHARILRTIPVDHTIFCFRYPDLHHGLLAHCLLATFHFSASVDFHSQRHSRPSYPPTRTRPHWFTLSHQPAYNSTPH